MEVISKRALILAFVALYWVSAILGLWASYDSTNAQTRFILLSVGSAIVITAALPNRQQRQRYAIVVAITSTAIASLSAGYYLLRPQYAHDALAGVIGSILAILLPMVISSLLWAISTKQRLLQILFALFLFIGIIGIAVTGERTAWLSLSIGLVVASLFWLVQSNEKWTKKLSLLTTVIGLAGFIGITLYITFLQTDVLSTWLVNNVHLNPESELLSRRELWNNARALLADYPFTGSGLGATKLSLATYIYINHVPGQPHVHNLYLQAGTEQGWLGLLSMAGMIIVAMALSMEAFNASKSENQSMKFAALASIVTLGLYGLFDAELYAYATAPLVFVPIAFSLLVRKSTRARQHIHRVTIEDTQWDTSPGFGPIVLSTVTLTVVIGLIWLNGDKLRSTLFTNLGAVAQTQAELSVYQWPQWGIQDQLRQSEGGVDLSQAERFLRIGLVFNPQNETALRRLGQIALARGEYAKAEDELSAAEQIAPHHRATRQLLGELLALRGELDKAVALWKSVSFLDGQLDGRIWWYEQLGNRQAAENIRQVMNKLSEK